MRLTRLLGNSLQADLYIVVPQNTQAYNFLKFSTLVKHCGEVDELQMTLLVSSVKVGDIAPSVEGRWMFEDRVEILGTDCQIIITQAERKKCPRCWTYTAEVEGELCGRCAEVVKLRQSGDTSI